jgi:hypothetical protein
MTADADGWSWGWQVHPVGLERGCSGHLCGFGAGGGRDASRRPHPDGVKVLRYVVHVGQMTKGAAVADLHIAVDGRDSDVESLQDWLRSEPEFRGHLRQGEAPGPDGAMGGINEVIIDVISSGAAVALARSLQVWLTQRRADVAVKVSGPGGREVVLDAKRISDAEHLLNTALGWAEGDPSASPPAD